MTDFRAQPLADIDLAAVSSLLADAFADDPAYQYFLKGCPPGKLQRYRLRLVTFIVSYHVQAGMPVWGLRHNGMWVAYALMETPISGFRRLLALMQYMPGLLISVPWVCIGRMNRYALESRADTPSNLHYYLVKIGVASDHQGKGCGKQLINALKDHYRTETDAIGLDTENPENVPLYEHLGFQLIDRRPLDDIILYRMRCKFQ